MGGLISRCWSGALNSRWRLHRRMETTIVEHGPDETDILPEPHPKAHLHPLGAKIIEVGLEAKKKSNLEDETRQWKFINSVFSQLKKDCPIFGILVIGETGTGKSTLINNLLGKEVAPVGHTMKSETLIVTPHELAVEGVPIVVYDTPGLDDMGGEEDEEKHLEIMKSLLARKKIHLVIYCLKMTETRMRRGLIRTFKEYHKIGVPWEQTVITLTFADKEEDSSRFSQMQEQVKETLIEMVGVKLCSVKGLKICPTAKYPDEALSTGRSWYVPFWLDVVEVLVPAALAQFLIIHKGNIHMEGAPASSQHRLVNVILAGEDKERFDRKVIRSSRPHQAEISQIPSSLIANSYNGCHASHPRPDIDAPFIFSYRSWTNERRRSQSLPVRPIARETLMQLQEPAAIKEEEHSLTHGSTPAEDGDGKLCWIPCSRPGTNAWSEL